MNTEKKMCAKCKFRGTGFDHRDASGVQHCSKFDFSAEKICICSDYKYFEKEDYNAE